MIRSVYKVLIPVLLLAAAACTKKTENTTQFAYGKVAVATAALPNTPDMVMYFNGDSVAILTPGSSDRDAKGQTADKKRLQLYEAGTAHAHVLVDTMIQLFKDSTISLKYAYSDALGIHGFLTGSTSTVNPDSCRFRLFNSLTTALQPEGVEVDAILCKDDGTGNFPYTGITFENFTRNKLHPMEVTVKATDSYALRFRNRATGAFLTDWLGDKANITWKAGKYLIISAVTIVQRNQPRLYTEAAEL